MEIAEDWQTADAVRHLQRLRGGRGITECTQRMLLNHSLKNAAVSIVLVATLLAVPGSVPSPDLGSSTAQEMAFFSLILVLAWMAIMAIVVKSDRQALARNLSVISFWVAVTLVLVCVAEYPFPDPLDRAIRLLSVWIMLLILVPLHMFRNMTCGRALLMTVVLVISRASSPGFSFIDEKHRALASDPFSRALSNGLCANTMMALLRTLL